ncbi:MAG TPA: hypothetical protein V6C89_08975 [Drouetiella sp.]|jgi:hypothetical protein
MVSTKSVTLARHSIALESLRVDFLTHNKRFYDWLASYYEQGNGNTAEYTITLEDLDSPHRIDLPARADGLFTKFCLIADAHCHFADGIFTSRAEGDLAHEIEIDVNARTVRGNLGGQFLKSEESFIYVVVRDILRRLVLPLNGYIMLHGSVVTTGDQTIFFAGDKAMGKSTIALEMMRHGFKIISDDSPIAFLSSDGAYVLSGRDQLSVTENTLKLFPELHECVSHQRDVSGKYFLDRRKLGSNRVTSEARKITDFVQLNRGSFEDLALTPIDKGLASANLIREFMPLFRKELVAETDPNFFRDKNNILFQTLGELLAGARAFELKYSDAHRTQIPSILSAISKTGT